MSATERPPSFQWYPRDFAAEMHQLGVSDAVELAYRRALDASWDSGNYGVGSPSQWIAWGRVEATLEAPYSQALAKVTQAQADGTLVQMRMARMRMEQEIRHRSATKYGSRGGRKSRGRKNIKPPSSHPQATLKPSQPHSSASASASASALEESTSTHLATGVAASGGKNGKRPDPKAEWLEGFAESFYPAYPRKVKPDDARKAWLQMRPWTQENLDAICQGLDKWIEHWRGSETPREKIPYPATFLRSGQWRGEVG